MKTYTELSIPAGEWRATKLVIWKRLEGAAWQLPMAAAAALMRARNFIVASMISFG